MKRFHALGLAVAAVLALVLTDSAFAQSPTNIMGSATTGRCKWLRGAGLTDSTRISIPAEGVSVDYADTTETVALTAIRFSQSYTGQPLAWFEIHSQATSAADTIAYIVQTTDDPNATDAGWSTGSTTNIVASANVVFEGRAIAVAPSSTVVVPRYMRLIVKNQATTAGRKYFSVTPVAWGTK